MVIAIDAMGGDFAPNSVVEGVIEALKALPPEVKILLIGQSDKVMPLLSVYGEISNLSFLNAADIIEMGEHPTKALSQKPNSSIAVGFKLLKNKEVDVFCSAGNTGAMMVGALFSVRAIEGIIRPAIAGFAPKISGGYAVIIDIGANADCKPEMLDQFAELGSIYCRATQGIDKPKVALMNIGEEEQKGSLVVQAAHQLLKNNREINFIGNIEGKDFLAGKADVIVCDGFTGNILLKFGESIYELLKSRGISDEFFDKTNYEVIGGSPIIGVNENVIIAHGSSKAVAIKNMVFLAKNQVDSGVLQQIKKALA
jgi:phosphate acyltransferase